MDAKQAISVLNMIETHGSLPTKAKELSIEALNKQIPKEPNYEGDGYADGYMVYDTWICPNCGTHYEVDYDHYKYCPECGQRLNLREV